MFHKKKWAKLTAAGLVFSLAATMAVGPAADADALASPQHQYKWEDTYTYAYEGSVVAYKDGEKQKDAPITKYETEDSDPFTPENEQAWDTEELVLKQGVSYTTKEKKLDENGEAVLDGVKVSRFTKLKFIRSRVCSQTGTCAQTRRQSIIATLMESCMFMARRRQ